MRIKGIVNDKEKNDGFSDDELKIYMAVPPEQKLKHIQEMNLLLKKIRPIQSKKLAERLAKEGF